MELKLDLHIHSEASPDGRMRVEEITELAKTRGLQGVAICDHNVLYRPREDTDTHGILVIPGIEFSTDCGHLLGLFLTEPLEGQDAESLIRGIHAQGGLAVLAHPFEHSADAERFKKIVPLLDGMELWNGRANRKFSDANDRARRFARENGLAGTGGSDAHLPREIGNGFVTVEVEELSLQAVKEALRRPGNPVSGQNGRHWDAARSRRTRLSKTNAGLGSRLKWFAYAGKCLLEDLLHRPLRIRKGE